MPIFKNALTNQPVNRLAYPVDQNFGAAFGYYPQLRRNRTVQDPQAAADMPVQFLRGRLAGTAGLPSDILNMIRTPTPMEVYGDVDYGAQPQVPYGSQELLKTLPLPPQGAAQEAAANIGAFMPLSPAEALKAARAATQTAYPAFKAGLLAMGENAAIPQTLNKQAGMVNFFPVSKTTKLPVVAPSGVMPENASLSKGLPNLSFLNGNFDAKVQAMDDAKFLFNYTPAWGGKTKPFYAIGDDLNELVNAGSARIASSEAGVKAAKTRLENSSVLGQLQKEFGPVFKTANSTQSKSTYLIHEPSGMKVRVSDHDLPLHYEQPDLDFRIGATTADIVKAIRQKLAE